jgi:MFS transporter, FSR family, fosmidomycin resistance protein
LGITACTSSVRKTAVLALYGCSHFLVDATCAALVFGLMWQNGVSSQDYFWMVIIYNYVAFSLQPILGVFADKVRNIPALAALGMTLTGLSMVLSPISIPVAVLGAGIGNAVFHVAGGSISMRLSPGKASPGGLFVAPGGLGLALGAFLTRTGPVISWPLIASLLFAVMLVLFLKLPITEMTQTRKTLEIQWPLLAAILLLSCVMIRSLMGFGVGEPWRNDKFVLFLIVCAAFLGKGIGGLISDRFGWGIISVTAILLSAPLIAFGYLHPAIAVAGMFLLQITMPVTLAALYSVLPRRPAFSFGLTCLALVIGATPMFAQWKFLYCSSFPIFIGILAAAACLLLALRMLSKMPEVRSELSAANMAARIPSAADKMNLAVETLEGG